MLFGLEDRILEKGEKENGIKGDQVLKRLKNGIWNPAIWER
jgi:hypothetical protein